MLKFRRCLLKLSGEALAGSSGQGIDGSVLDWVAKEIASSVKAGAQIGLVIGGGNFIRGVSASASGLGRAAGDSMGMLATVMNALAMQDSLEQHGVQAEVMSAIRMEPLCGYFRAFGKQNRCAFCSRHRQPLFHHRHRRRSQSH